MGRKILNLAFLFLFFGLLLAPLTRLDWRWQGSGENRTLAGWPAFGAAGARGAAKFQAFFRGVEAWLNDHIGYRGRLVELYGRLYLQILKTSRHAQLLPGRDGHYFYASHRNKPGLLLVKQLLSIPPPEEAQITALAQEVETLYDQSRKLGRPSVFVVIPQKHWLDRAALPWHVAKFIRPGTRPVEELVKEALPPGTALLYPLAEAEAENQKAALYPKANFHWVSGRHTRLMAAKIAAHFGLAAYEPPSLEECVIQPAVSDIGGFAGFPLADPAFLGYKPGLFKELGIETGLSPEEADYLSAYSFSRNRALPEGTRILWLGDSFSPAVCPDLARNFREALCVDIVNEQRNGFKKFPDKNLASFIQRLMDDWRPDYVVWETHLLIGGVLKLWAPVLAGLSPSGRPSAP